jgi:DMSO reductase anchor subunit
VPNYLALGLMTGALWLFALFGTTPLLPLAAIVAAAALKLGYWRFIDTTRSASTAESATGLGRFGKVRQLEAPHTEDNYLLREMGYRVARRHARRLRLVALALGFLLPFALCLAGFYVPSLGILAALSGMAGVFVERWLFFAEARHTVTLFYGAATA